MKSQDKKLAQQQKSKELFALSNQLFATAKKLSDYHAAELKSSMAYALSYAKTAANQDMAQLKALQGAVATEATKRMETYQAKVKIILNQMEGKSVDQHLKDARTALTAWYKATKKKVPQGAEQLGQVAHDVADAGIRAFKEGRKLVNAVADAAEKSLKKVAKKEAAKVKKATTKKPAVKKSPVKKLAVRKAPAKKVATSITPPSTELPT